MLKSQKIEVVNASDICKAMGITDEEFDQAVDCWTFGDTMFTLVGNIEFLYAIMGWPSGSLDRDKKEIEKKYFAIVPNGAYINLEK